MKIREVKVGDEEQFLTLLRKVDQESDFMLYEHGERKATVEQQKNVLIGLEKDERSTFFVVEQEGEFVGYLMAKGGFAKRKQHTLYLVIGIIREYRGKGVGTMLFSAMEKWARKRQFHRLELTVVSKNEAAVGLYKKMGFEIEGIKRDSLYIKGEYADEYYMAKLLTNDEKGTGQ